MTEPKWTQSEIRRASRTDELAQLFRRQNPIPKNQFYLRVFGVELISIKF